MSAFWRKLWIATEIVSVTKQAMESYSKCVRFEENYGAIGSVSLMKKYRKCLPQKSSYGQLQEVSPLWSQLWTATESVSVWSYL